MLALLVTLGPGAGAAGAVVPVEPSLGAVWASSVSSSTARLSAQINPNGSITTYRFDYLPQSAYEANLGAGKDGFTGAKRAPAGSDASIGSGVAVVTALQLLSSLAPDTSYRYRIITKNSAGEVMSLPQAFVTQPLPGAAFLPDGRGWEMVTPADKNGGALQAPGSGGVLQAAAGGNSITYASTASFEAGAAGAPPASQYIASHGAGAWSTQNVSAPLYSGSYAGGEGAPYRLFSADLARGLLSGGSHCRGEAAGCPVPNPPLAGSDAPAGYQNYYLRESSGGAFTALLTSSALASLDLDPARFDLSFAGASPDLSHVVLASCAALAPNATEAPLGEGCDPKKPNLYEYSPGAGLSLLNALPGQTQGTPGAALAAQGGAVSGDGNRVYWVDSSSGNLYLREGGETKLVEAGGEFQTAAGNGSVAFFTKVQLDGKHLYRYEAASGAVTDLTPAAGAQGVLGASEDGAYVYYLSAAGLFLRHGATTTEVAPAADSGSYPPTTGSARVSADGIHLLFISSARLTGYDNTDLNTGSPDSEVFLYDAGENALTCVSCNPTNGRPIGPSSIPGSIASGSGADAADSYKPRVLSADGRRVFFDSGDALGLADTNAAPDVYQWEAQGEGSCAHPGGCAALISSGKAQGGASFLDASADGADAFFLTEASLVGSDPGSPDLYDARVGGGFPVAPVPIPCEGDACQSLPSEPVDPTLTTLLSGPGNPAVRYQDHKRPPKHKEGHHKKGHHKKHHKHHGHKHQQRGSGR